MDEKLNQTNKLVGKPRRLKPIVGYLCFAFIGSGLSAIFVPPLIDMPRDREGLAVFIVGLLVGPAIYHFLPMGKWED